MGLMWMAIGATVVALGVFGADGGLYLHGPSSAFACYLMQSLSSVIMITLAEVICVGVVSTAFSAAQQDTRRRSEVGHMASPFDALPPLALQVYHVGTAVNFVAAIASPTVRVAVDGAFVADAVMLGCFVVSLTIALLLLLFALIQVIPLIPDDTSTVRSSSTAAAGGPLSWPERWESWLSRRARIVLFLTCGMVLVAVVVVMLVLNIVTDLQRAALGTPFLPYLFSSASGSLTTVGYCFFIGSVMILLQVWQGSGPASAHV